MNIPEDDENIRKRIHAVRILTIGTSIAIVTVVIVLAVLLGFLILRKHGVSV